MKILVCDDLEDRCEEVVAAIEDAGQANVEITSLVGEQLRADLTKLFENVNVCLKEPKSYKTPDKLSFDDAHLVVLDNNLAHLGVKGARLTAESIAGYIRAFTVAGYIVSLNKNPEVDFDLRYLVGDYATRTDLALNTRHLANPALWTRKPVDAQHDFLPWYWPELTTVADRRKAQIQFVQDHFGDPVFGAVGIPEGEAIDFLSRHARGALSPDAESDGPIGRGGIRVQEVSFKDVFAASSRSLLAEDEREKLLEGAASNNSQIRQMISRVIAADIDLWFRRDLIAPQEALVDVPHLLMRLPFLLGAKAGDIDEWNKCVTAKSAPFGVEKLLYDTFLAKAKFEQDVWVPSPSFWWPKLKADEKLNELFFKAKQGEWGDVVFCEDRSVFLERSSTGEGVPPTEFSAEFEGSWGQRYVARIDGFRYSPRSRFAL